MGYRVLSNIDWLVLIGSLTLIIVYGVYKTRGSRDLHGYLRGNQDSRWWLICLSVMATQASAITFLSTPGQAYSDGMRFVQFYLGLPIAMVILCVTFIPIYYKLKVYTAYEYLESRFDLKTRSLAAILFLIQRGMAAGITIFAPSIILSSILGWNLNLTIVVIGILVIIYTVTGGTKAVNQTQKLQMFIILSGMTVAFIYLLTYIPEDITVTEAFHIAGATGKMQAIDFSLNFESRYTIWAGITGGLFLQLAYFGTDQSQVQRYLTGSSVRQSRLGLLLNGMLKVPMQFFILLTGILVFVFYQFHKPPVFFNQPEYHAAMQTLYKPDLESLQLRFDSVYQSKSDLNRQYISALRGNEDLRLEQVRTALISTELYEKEVRSQVKEVISAARPDAELNDRDYVFITFILNHLPVGVIGLLLAVIFSAAMSATAAELNALGTTTSMDIYRRSISRGKEELHYVSASKGFTLLWGCIAICFALFGALFENLIQFVNIIGSLFYGTLLGLFLVAFYVKYVRGTAVFIAALLAEATVLGCYFLSGIGFLWYNVIGCTVVVSVGITIEMIFRRKRLLT
ncbi:MAG TPA: sodium:solute symporter [Saprospiraceae bacterium]|nr:sodium:solute symporter [Saprospiraceae bacterium]